MKEQFEQHIDLLPELTEEEVDLYCKHLEVLTEWNEKMNLVSSNSLAKAFAFHYCDSIQIADYGHRAAEGRPVFDLGSGAGFPGLIYAIRYPEETIVLYEKIQKKQHFLKAAVEALGLANAKIEGSLPEKKFHGLFLGRAVMQRQDLFPFMRTRLKEGARLVTNLGGQTEVTPAPPDFMLLDQTQYDLPGDAGSRKIEAYEFVPRGTK